MFLGMSLKNIISSGFSDNASAFCVAGTIIYMPSGVSRDFLCTEISLEVFLRIHPTILPQIHSESLPVIPVGISSEILSRIYLVIFSWIGPEIFQGYFSEYFYRLFPKFHSIPAGSRTFSGFFSEFLQELILWVDQGFSLILSEISPE